MLSRKSSRPPTPRGTGSHSRTNFNDSMFSFADPDSMAAEYGKLREEIAAVQCEIVPLRARSVELQQALLGYQAEPSAIDFSSAMIQFQIEETSLDRQLRTIRFLHSAKSLHELHSEIDTGESACETLAISLDRIDKEMQNVIGEIETYKLSKLYEEVQRQKRKIIKLGMELDAKMQVHAQLKAERFALTDDSARAAGESSVIERLTHRLVTARRHHADECERFLVIHRAQVREIEEVRAALAISEATREEGPVRPPPASIVLLRQALAGITGLDSSPAPWDG